MRNPSDLSARPDDAAPGLSDALVERLRRAAPPDPGDAYFDALPARVRARLASEAPRPRCRSAAPDARPARAPERRAPPLRTAHVVTAAAVLLLAAVALFHTQRPAGRLDRPATGPLAQARTPVPPAAATPSAPDTVLPGVRVPVTPASPPRGGGTPGARTRRAPERRLAAPVVPGVPASGPVRTQRLATAPAPSSAVSGTEALPAAPQAVPASAADVEGHRLLRRAQMVVLAVQNATNGADVAVLQPLAARLADDLTRWRATAPRDSGVRALVDLVEPVVLGVATLDPSDADTARQLVAAAQRADLSLQLDRALLVAGDLPSLVY